MPNKTIFANRLKVGQISVNIIGILCQWKITPLQVENYKVYSCQKYLKTYLQLYWEGQEKLDWNWGFDSYIIVWFPWDEDSQSEMEQMVLSIWHDRKFLRKWNQMSYSNLMSFQINIHIKSVVLFNLKCQKN